MDTSSSNTASWFYEEDGRRKGPITEEVIVKLIQAGKISYGSLVWKNGFSEWLKMEDTELRHHLGKVVPPPISGKHVNNTIVWVLAFAPLIGFLFEVFVSFMIDGSGDAGAAAIDNDKYWYITLALNIGLSYFDEKRLGQAGWDTSKFKGMTWLVPVYLFKRAKVLNQSLAYFIVWLACFAISMAI